MSDPVTPPPGEVFSRAIAPYLAAGMPAKHGMSVEAYVIHCRALWDACQTDEKCPDRLIIDRLYAETLTFHELGNPAYVDPRARATTDVAPRPKDTIYCIAVGTVPLWSVVGDGDATMPSAVEDTPESSSDFGLYIIAVLDVLGFERMYRRLGPQRMRETYERLISAAQTCTDTFAVGMNRFDGAFVPTVFRFDVGFAYFSDTLLLWAPLGETHVSPFLARCSDVFLEALALGIPLRGAIAVGEAILDQRNGVFLGTPLIDAARLEQAQDWLGVMLTRSCTDVLAWLDSSLLLPYTPPCKPDTKADLHGGLALDWPRRARTQHIDAAAALEAMQVPNNQRRYYDHARAFVDHSLQHARWNQEHHIPICIGFLTRSILRSRLDGVPAPPEAVAMLDSMTMNADGDPVAARGFRSLLEGSALPDAIDTLPEEKRDHLCFVQDVVNGAYIDLDEIAMAALEQRKGISALSTRHEGYLARPATERNAVWQQCIPFLRALADGTDLPEVPEDLPDAAQQILRQARRAASGETVAVDLEALISAVVWARTNNTTLSDLNLRRLEVLCEASPWDAVAEFLRAVAGGVDPDVQLGTFDEAAVSTVQAVRKILGWQEAARRSVVDALRALEPVDLRVLLEAAVRTIAVVRGEPDAELGLQLARLLRSGSPHDAVARYFQRLLANRCATEPPGGVDIDVTYYLKLVSACAFEEDIGKSLVPYLFAVASQASMARRPLTLYEAAVFSLVLSMNEELGAVVKHLVAFVAGEMPDTPQGLQDDLRRLVEGFHKAVDGAIPVNPADLATATLACRRGKTDPEFVKYLRDSATLEDPKGRITRFLLGVIEETAIPAVPDSLDDDARQELALIGINAACEPLGLHDLARAVLNRRWYATPLDDRVSTALGVLTTSGEPFSSIGQFLSDLSKRHLWPALPTGLPRRIFLLLASARRHAHDFSRRVIGISRQTDRPETQGGLPQS
jgi:hypothetical protein